MLLYCLNTHQCKYIGGGDDANLLKHFLCFHFSFFVFSHHVIHYIICTQLRQMFLILFFFLPSFHISSTFFEQKLAEDLTIHRILNVKNDHYKVQYRDANAQNVLTIGKKEFHHLEHQIRFKESWVKKTINVKKKLLLIFCAGFFCMGFPVATI